MAKPELRVATLVAVVLLSAASCQSPDVDATGSTNQASVKLYLIDAPADFMQVAEVTISRAYMMPGDVDLFPPEEGPHVLDLLQLRDGIQALIGDSPVSPGTYNQLRLVVDGSQITLADPFTYSDGSKTKAVQIGSGWQTGIKVALQEPIEAQEGMVTMLVVDFDVDQSFVMQGDPFGPQGIHGWLFVPVIVETDRGHTAA